MAIFELVTSNQHRCNSVESAIHTYKNHLIAGLATCDPYFLIIEWDKIFYQCELTLNFLQTSRVNPNLLTWAYFNGVFDFNKTPLAPSDTKVISYSKPDKRVSWAYHGVEGWYVGLAVD